MSKRIQREGSLVVAVRTEGAIILPKPLRERLDLRPGDLMEVEVRGKNIVLHPRPSGRLQLRGVPAASQKSLVGALQLGGDAVKDKKRLYER